MAERNQDHSTRSGLFAKLEEELDKPVISFFTSFNLPVMLEDNDVDMMAGALQGMDLAKGLVVVVSSPGGDGLAAERMISVCRSYSQTSEYWVIVPGKAKSAATMFCFGASQILMGPTSELGPVDPQITIRAGETQKRFSVYNVIESYKELFGEAVSTPGNLEPYLQQLSYYDAREIREFESALELSKDISIRTLASGMLSGSKEAKIEEKIETFLTPKNTKTHGRPIYRDEAAECGLKIDKLDAQSAVWQLVYELYVRTNQFMSNRVAKCIETREHSLIASI
jgi:hypothetical protein